MALSTSAAIEARYTRLNDRIAPILSSFDLKHLGSPKISTLTIWDSLNALDVLTSGDFDLEQHQRVLKALIDKKLLHIISGEVEANEWHCTWKDIRHGTNEKGGRLCLRFIDIAGRLVDALALKMTRTTVLPSLSLDQRSELLLALHGLINTMFDQHTTLLVSSSQSAGSLSTEMRRSMLVVYTQFVFCADAVGQCFHVILQDDTEQVIKKKLKGPLSDFLIIAIQFLGRLWKSLSKLPRPPEQDVDREWRIGRSISRYLKYATATKQPEDSITSSIRFQALTMVTSDDFIKSYFFSAGTQTQPIDAFPDMSFFPILASLHRYGQGLEIVLAIRRYGPTVYAPYAKHTLFHILESTPDDSLSVDELKSKRGGDIINIMHPSLIGSAMWYWKQFFGKSAMAQVRDPHRLRRAEVAVQDIIVQTLVRTSLWAANDLTMEYFEACEDIVSGIIEALSGPENFKWGKLFDIRFRDEVRYAWMRKKSRPIAWASWKRIYESLPVHLPLFNCGAPSCQKTLENPRICSRCEWECYCSTDCQKLHWKSHKKDCKTIAEIRKFEQESRPRLTASGLE